MALAGAFATCSGGLMPQAAARCFLAGASTVQLLFANGTGRCLCHLQWRAYAAGSGSVLSRWREARCIFRSPMAQAGAFATCSGGLMQQAAARCFLAGAKHGASFVRHGTGRCLCRAAATEQRAPGRALCTPRPCASPARRCAVPSLPQPS